MLNQSPRSCKSLQIHADRLQLCEKIAKNSKCLSRHVGALLIKDNKVVSKGYNRVPKCTHNCEECIRKSKKSGEALDICKAIHAEEACLLNYLKNHTVNDLKDCVLYTSVSPCYNCAKLITDLGIKMVYSHLDYKSNYTNAIFDEAGVRLIIL